MKKFTAVVFAIFMVFAMSACSKEEVSYDNMLDKILATGELTIATSPDFPPLEFQILGKKGQDSYVGADISLAKYIAEQLGAELKIEAMDFSTCLAAATDGTVDLVISGLAWKPDRAESMELSRTYNYEAQSPDDGHTVLVLKDEVDSYKTAADFAGKKVAAQTGSLQYELVEGELHEDVVIEPITDLTTAVLMLTSGKVNAVAVSKANGESFAKNYPEIAVAEFMFDFTDDGNVVGTKKGESELIAKVNELIDKAEAEGLLQKWYDEAKELADSQGIN